MPYALHILCVFSQENTLANNMLVYNCTTSMQNKPSAFITCWINVEWVEIDGKRVISLSK